MHKGLRLLAYAAAFISVGVARADDRPIKIGILTELSGVMAVSGQHERNGFLLYLNKNDGKLGGRTVVTIVEDTAGDPGTALSKAKKLVNSDAIDLLIGPVNSATGAAIKDFVIAQKIPTLMESTVDEVIDSPYTFRTSFANNADAYLQGYLPGAAGLRKAVIFAPNYTSGQAAAAYFEKGFEAAGGKVMQKLLPRLGTTDYGPFITQIASDADVVIVFMPGSDGVRFIKQFADFGAKLPLYGFTSAVDEALLPAEGKAAVGFTGAAFYFSTIDTPENKIFLKDWNERYASLGLPSWISVGGYIAAQALDQAIKAVGGKIDDKDALLAAIKNVRFASPAGPFRFDASNNAILPRYIMRIGETNGAIAPVILGVIPEFAPVLRPPVLPSGLVLAR